MIYVRKLPLQQPRLQQVVHQLHRQHLQPRRQLPQRLRLQLQQA